MKIAYATTFNVQDRSSWPRRHLGLYGTGQKIAGLLQAEGVEVEFLGPLHLQKNSNYPAQVAILPRNPGADLL
ncbi:MAG: hypothetical protein HC929_17260 [Leptolyngbyaceae cyanobacterium SM2_5_2]|nr:hypothetical protein [Leptolyngbyaceae cyanobacterium SM2_5_2]